jgi:hypothetical protein
LIYPVWNTPSDRKELADRVGRGYLLPPIGVPMDIRAKLSLIQGADLHLVELTVHWRRSRSHEDDQLRTVVEHGARQRFQS